MRNDRGPEAEQVFIKDRGGPEPTWPGHKYKNLNGKNKVKGTVFPRVEIFIRGRPGSLSLFRTTYFYFPKEERKVVRKRKETAYGQGITARLERRQTDGFLLSVSDHPSGVSQN